MSTGSTTQASTPWGPQGKRYKQLFNEADKFLNQELDYYPGSTISDRNPWQSMANQNIADMVAAGSPGLQSAMAENQRTTSGQYLSPFSNPYLREVGDTAAQDISRSYQRTVMPGISSRFGGSGRSTGGGAGMSSAEGAAMSASQRDLGQELSQMYANLYGGAYESERGRMGSAVGQAPGLRQAEFADQAALSAAGADEFQYAQMQLSDLVNRWNFEQYEPWERMGLYQGMISQPGGYGETKNTSKLGTAQYIGMIGSALAPSLGSLLGGGDSGMIAPGQLG
jgi:hypothetical protein